MTRVTDTGIPGTIRNLCEQRRVPVEEVMRQIGASMETYRTWHRNKPQHSTRRKLLRYFDADPGLARALGESPRSLHRPTLRDVVDELCEEHDITRKYLAQQLGCSPQAIYGWATKVPGRRLSQALCEYFDYDVRLLRATGTPSGYALERLLSQAQERYQYLPDHTQDMLVEVLRMALAQEKRR